MTQNINKYHMDTNHHISETEEEGNWLNFLVQICEVVVAEG